MNRYPRGGPSRATASTQCQKCLERGHYSYECNAAAGDRPYTARPSRTQQLLNPRHAPKLLDVAPPEDLKRKKGVADEILARKEEERGRKRRKSDERDLSRSRSRSKSSVSTISSTRSRSESPAQLREKTMSGDNSCRRPRHHKQTYRRRQRSRTDSSNTSERQAGGSGQHHSRQPETHKDRNGRAALVDLRSPVRLGSRSRSLTRESLSENAQLRNSGHGHIQSVHEQDRLARTKSTRQRSLSPYSKRVALTQSMNK